LKNGWFDRRGQFRALDAQRPVGGRAANPLPGVFFGACLAAAAHEARNGRLPVRVDHLARRADPLRPIHPPRLRPLRAVRRLCRLE